MARVKGIIAEVDGGKCMLVTQDGQFLRVNKPVKAVVGEEIEVSQTGSWLRLVPAMVAILVLSFIIPSFNLLTASAEPIAYLSLDINPSVDVGVDKNGEVVAVKALNPAGEKLAAVVPLNKLKVYEAVHLMVEQAIKEGFVNYSKANLIMAAYTGGTDYTFNEQQLKADIETQIKEADLEAEIVVLNTDMKIHKQASSSDISQGKYQVYEAAKAQGKTLSLQELKDDGIKNTLISKGVQVGDLLPGVEKVEIKKELEKKESPSIKSKGDAQEDKEKEKRLEKQFKAKDDSASGYGSKGNEGYQNFKRESENSEKKSKVYGKSEKDHE